MNEQNDFRWSVVKPKLKWLLWPNKTDADNPMNQSELEAKTSSRSQARENACGPVTISFTSDWLKSWARFLNQSKSKTKARATYFRHSMGNRSERIGILSTNSKGTEIETHYLMQSLTLQWKKGLNSTFSEEERFRTNQLGNHFWYKRMYFYSLELTTCTLSRPSNHNLRISSMQVVLEFWLVDLMKPYE